MAAQQVYRFKSADEFRCIQDKCEYNCCSNWKIPIDDSALKKYRHDYPKVHQLIASSGSFEFLPRDDQGRCKFLTQGMCKIHGEHGPEALTSVCDKYPRQAHGDGQAKIQSVMPSCPEAARKLFLDDTAFSLIQVDDHEASADFTTDESNILTPQAMVELTSQLVTMFLRSPRKIEETLFYFVEIVQRLDSIDIEQWSTHLDLSNYTDSDLPLMPKKLKRRSQCTIALMLELIYLATDPALSDYKKIFESGLRLEFSLGTTSPSMDSEEGLVLNDRLKQELECIEPWLRRHLAAAISSLGLPLESQTVEGRHAGKTASLWAKKIASDFLVVRYFLLCLVRHEENGSPSEAQFIDMLFRVYRILYHSDMTEREEKEFTTISFEDIYDQMLYL